MSLKNFALRGTHEIHIQFHEIRLHSREDEEDMDCESEEEDEESDEEEDDHDDGDDEDDSSAEEGDGEGGHAGSNDETTDSGVCISE